jgi:hypothetical protein
MVGDATAGRVSRAALLDVSQFEQKDFASRPSEAPRAVRPGSRDATEQLQSD